MKLSVVAVFLYTSVVAVFARKGFGPTEQEWGFVTVRKGAHMFWWLHQTSAPVKSYTERPLLIWLQGGPGASSTGYGNFGELGPLDADLNPRPTTWTNNYNLLFVDNPVGTGYSHVDSNSYLATTNRQIAEDFLVLLKGFYEAVPELRNTPMYIFSESYGGKMTAEIGLLLDKAIKNGSLNINFLGVGLGDSWISPVDSVMTWGPYLLNLGIVDQNEYERIQSFAEETKAAVINGNYAHASNLWVQTERIISSLTSNVDFYNILTKIPTIWKTRKGIVKPSLRDELDDRINILMNDVVNVALDLNVTWGDQASAVFDGLFSDFMKPATEIVELLLNTTNLKVAVYNGQLDLIVDTPGTIKWVDALKFKGAEKWKDSPRNPIIVDDFVEGYYKRMDNFAMYWVDRAGHMVPEDNPVAMNYILEDMTNFKTFQQN